MSVTSRQDKGVAASSPRPVPAWRQPSPAGLPAWLARPVVRASLLTGLLLLAAALRLYRLGAWSFWGDEIFTVSGLEDGFNYSPFRQSLSLGLIQAVVATAGTSEWTARLVPALFGFLTVPVTYYTVRAFGSRPVALFAALLLAVSPWHIYWSQNARFYTALLLFFWLALFFFFQGLEQDRPWFLLFSLLCFSLAARERLIALFFLPIVLGYLLLLRFWSGSLPRGWRRRNMILFWLPCLLGGALFAGPYLADLPGWMAGFGYANNTPAWLLAGFTYYVGLPVVGLGATGGAFLIARRQRAALLLATAALLPILVLMALAPFHYTANRYAFVSLLPWLVLAASAVVHLWRHVSGRARLLAVGVGLILVGQLLADDALYYLVQHGNRPDWRAAMAVVQAHRRPGDGVFSANPQLAAFYLGQETPGFASLDLAAINSQCQRVWFIEDMVAVEVFPAVHQWLAENARLVSVNDVNVQSRNFLMRVYLYEPGEETCRAP